MTDVNVIVDVDAGGGHDYTAIDDAEAQSFDLTSKDLVTNTETLYLKCRNSSGGSDTTAFSISGYTTSTTYNINIIADTGYEADGKYDNGFKIDLDIQWANGIDIDDHNVTFEDIQIETSNAGWYAVDIGSSTDNLIFNRCFLGKHTGNIFGLTGSGSSGLEINNSVIFCSSTSEVIDSIFSFLNYLTIANCVLDGGFNDLVDTTSASEDNWLTVVNCAGSTWNYNSSNDPYDTDSDYNVSFDDNSAETEFGATNSWGNATLTDLLTCTDTDGCFVITETAAGSEDYHLQDHASNDAQDAGAGPSDATLGSYVPTTDIDGDSRSGSTCDIGIDEVVAAGPDYTLVADYGSFTLTGQAATLTASRLLTAAQGSFTLTGQAAGLKVSRYIIAGTRNFLFLEQDASLIASRILDAGQGSISLTGQEAVLLVSRLLDAQPGSLSLTGQDASLLVSRLLDAESGSISLTGQDASLLVSRVLGASSGSFTLTGQDATLVYSGADLPDYTLTADSGSFTFTGQGVSLLVSRLLSAVNGSFTLTGQDVSLLVSRTLAADYGSFTLTGQDAGLVYSGGVPADYTLTADAGSFTLTGQASTLLVSRLLSAAHGVLSFSGQDVSLLVSRLLSAIHGTITLSGQEATLLVSRVLSAEHGSFALTGMDALLVYSGAAIITPPDSRVYAISSRDRVYSIGVESRVYPIPT